MSDLSSINQLCVKIEVKVMFLAYKRKLKGGERIFLSLSYGRVVELRPRPTWSMLVIIYYKEIN